MRLVTRIAVNTVCATALLALVSCGAGADSGPFGDLSGAEVTNKALTTTKKAESMRLALDMETTDGRIRADFSSSTSGQCTGTMSMSPKGTVEIIKTGDTVYTKYDEALLRQESEGEPAEEVDATVKLLAGIAEGLGYTVSALLGEDGGAPVEAINVVRRAERRMLVDPRSGVERHVLAPALLQRGVEVIWYEIPPGQETGAFPPHRPGVEEHITVVAGHLRCTLAGQELTLETGDSVTFRADIVHNFANAGADACRYLLIIL